MIKKRSILCKRNKETEAEKLRLEFLDTSMRAHTQACVRSQLYVCKYFEPVYKCRKHAHVDTTLRNRNAKNRAKKKKTKQNKKEKKRKKQNKN